MVTEVEFEKYACDEYMGGQYRSGFYYDDSYLQLVLPLEQAYLGGNDSHLVFGHAGADGIEFCYRQEKEGIWAFYPIDQEYELKSKTLSELVLGWCNGSITV